MSYSSEHPLGCAEPGCEAILKNSRWDKIKSGWFQQKDGRNWCLEHTPEWVEEWRKKNG